MSDENLLEMISFLVNGQAFCLDVSVIREIRGWTPATPLPMSPPEVRGVINLRGVIMPVVDLKARLDQGLTEPSSRHVIIVMQLGDRQAGLLVEAVQETFKISRSELQAPPSLTRITVRDPLGWPSKSFAAFSSVRLIGVKPRALRLMTLALIASFCVEAGPKPMTSSVSSQFFLSGVEVWP